MKKPITNQAELKAEIARLEQNNPAREVDIKQTFGTVKTNLAPRNVLKNTFSHAMNTPEVNKILINTAVGFALGYASKKVAEMVNEKSVNTFIEGFINEGLTRVENKDPESKLGKAINFVRSHIDKSHPLHPFIAYKNNT